VQSFWLDHGLDAKNGGFHGSHDRQGAPGAGGKHSSRRRSQDSRPGLAGDRLRAGGATLLPLRLAALLPAPAVAWRLTPRRLPCPPVPQAHKLLAELEEQKDQMDPQEVSAQGERPESPTSALSSLPVFLTQDDDKELLVMQTR
jgi:hypothetical protein